MAGVRVQRRLAAILAADMVGYSRLMEADERGTIARQRVHREEAIDPRITEFGGRIVKTTGDGLLVEFPSVVDATECAVALQRAMTAREADMPEGRRIRYRIGINLGDIVADGDDMLGDGVNVAARLEALATPGGICVSGPVYDQVRNKIDVAFDDLGERKVKNIETPVRVYAVRTDGIGAPGSGTRAEPGASLDLPAKPSIAVLPFESMGGDEEQTLFADGITEDIITSLSKVSGLFVIARNSSFAFGDKGYDLRRTAAELGVRYVLKGSIRTAGKRMRVSVQLIDAQGGGHLWAERYDRILDDVFAVQDEITLAVATELQVRLTEGEQARLRYTTTSNVEAWKHWVQGLAWFRRDISRDEFGRARECWEKALALDTQSAALNAMLGLLHCTSARFGWWEDREIELARTAEYVRTAIALDGENADAHIVRALLLLIEGRHDEAVADARRAIDLGPNSADIAELASFVFSFSGRADEGLVQIERAMRLTPGYPSRYLGILGLANRLLSRYEEAIVAFKEYGRRSPGFGHVDLIILYGDLGRKEDAQAEAARLLAARPGFTISAWRRSQSYKDPARLEADVAALRAAGVPQ